MKVQRYVRRSRIRWISPFPGRRAAYQEIGGTYCTNEAQDERPQILWSCKVIRLGDHVVVKGEDEEAIVTAVHPDSQIEIEFLKASEGGPRRRRYAAEALEKISR